MDTFEQLLYETRFSTKETIDRIKTRYSEEELKELTSMPLVEREKLIQKYSQTNLSKEDLMKKELKEYLSILVSLINREYGNYIPKDRLDKLNSMILNEGIIVINNPEDDHDFSADIKNSKVIVNLAKIGKTKTNYDPDIFTQITAAKGTLPHELFHIIIQMLKPEEIADERMVINLSDGSTITSRGMVGFMLNEGFVEKFSNEFCQKYGLYYSIAPQYIPYVDICNYFIKQNPKINALTIFSLDEADCINCLNEYEKQKYYYSEAISYAVRHKNKKAEDVLSSHIEKVEIDLEKIPPERLAELQNYYNQKNIKLLETMQISNSLNL